jgi:hypothetical protein
MLGYASDPDVVTFNGKSYMTWADGDFGTCGGFHSAVLNPDFLSIDLSTIKAVTINGLSSFGTCTTTGGVSTGVPYVEGPSIYAHQYVSGYDFTMIFPIKPANGTVPTECQTSKQPNTDNSVIAWAIGTSAQGPFTYQGILVCGNGLEWTDQASITTTDNGRQVIYFHDAAGDKMRLIQAECFYSGSGRMAGAFRQLPDSSVAHGFYGCTHGTDNPGYVALWGKDHQALDRPPILSTGGGAVTERYFVGQNERFRFELDSGTTDTYGIRALGNNNFLCVSDAGTLLAPTCDFKSDLRSQFVRVYIPHGPGTFNLKSVTTGRYLGIDSTGIRAFEVRAEDSAEFATLSYMAS